MKTSLPLYCVFKRMFVPAQLRGYLGFTHRLSEEERSIPRSFSLLSWMRHQNDSESVSLEANVLV